MLRRMLQGNHGASAVYFVVPLCPDRSHSGWLIFTYNVLFCPLLCTRLLVLQVAQHQHHSTSAIECVSTPFANL